MLKPKAGQKCAAFSHMSAIVDVLTAETQLAATLQSDLTHMQTCNVHFAGKLEVMTCSSAALKV